MPHADPFHVATMSQARRHSDAGIPDPRTMGAHAGGSPNLVSTSQYMEKSIEALTLDPKETGRTQRRRGVSFREEYRSMKNSRSRARGPSMIHEPTKDIIPPQRRDAKTKITVVLDLDETLIYAREGPLYARPHTDLLLQLLKDHFETVVWTAGVKAYAQSIIRNIDPEGIIEHCIYRHKRWFSGRAGYQKDLTMLGRSMDRVIIIENTPDCIRGNPENGVLVSDYEGGEAGDPTIPALIHFLAGLAESKMTVPEFLRTSSMLKTASVLTDVGDVFSVHVLNCAAADVKTSKRINRDLRVQIGERPSSPGSDGGESRPEQQKRSPRGHTEDPSDGGGRRRLDSSNPLPRNAVPLCVPMSPNGTFHEEWAKANAKRGSILSSCM